MFKGERIVFVEFEHDVLSFLDFHPEGVTGLDTTIFFPLSFPSQLILKKKNIPYSNTLAYFDRESHKSALLQSEKWLRMIESHLDLKNVLFKELIFHLRFIINYLLWLSDVLTAALNRHKPRTVFCPEKRASFASSPKMTSGDRFLGSMIDQYASSSDIDVKYLKNEEPKTPDDLNLCKNRKSPASSRPFISRIVQKSTREIFKNKNIALVANSGYGIIPALKEPETIPGDRTLVSLDFKTYPKDLKNNLQISLLLLKSGIQYLTQNVPSKLPVGLFSFQETVLESNNNEVEKTIHDLADGIEGGWDKDFSYRGINLAPYIAGKLRRGITPFLLHLSMDYERLKTVLETVRPEIVLSPCSVSHASLLADLCKNLNVPSALIPHGSLAPPRNDLEEIEWKRLSQAQMLSDYSFVVAQSPLAEQHAAHFHVSHKVWKTPPLLFAKVSPNKRAEFRQKYDLPEKMKVIVYAVAQRKRSSVRFHMFETEDEYHSSMADVVNAVNQMQEAFLIIKLHPAIDYSAQHLAQFLPKSERMLIIQKDPFEDVLAGSDVLVSFYSTTVEEALQNRIPFVLFDKWKRYSFLDVFDCSQIDPDGWQPDVGYYIDDPERLARVFSFAIEHASRAAKNEALTSRYVFQKGETRPLSYYLNRPIHPEERE